MAALFGGVAPQPSIDKFMMRSFFADLRVPHTRKNLSPIFVKEWLSRNNVIVLNTYDVYDAMNNTWREWIKNNESFITGNQIRSSVNLDAADEPVEGSWNFVIDYFMRLIKVKDIDDPYYQMHYVAICSHNFHKDLRDDTETDELVKNCYRSVWDQAINPILYETLIPVTYDWLPIERYADITFNSDIASVVDRVNSYIETHRAGRLNLANFNAVMLVQYYENITTTLKVLVANKHKDPSTWVNAIKTFLTTIKMIDVEFHLHDGIDVNIIKMSGLYGLDLIHRAGNLCTKYNDGVGTDADALIDELLGVYPAKEEYDKAKKIYDKLFHTEKADHEKPVNRIKQFLKKFVPNHKDGDDGHEAQHVKA